MSVPRKPAARASEADPEVTELLRTVHAPPGGEGYWASLEDRIMASVRSGPARLSLVVQEQVSWWSGFGEFRWADLRAAGLVAATLALLAAGASFVREQADDAHARELATRAAIEATLPLPIDEAMLSRAPRHLAPDAPERYLNPLDY